MPESISRRAGVFLAMLSLGAGAGACSGSGSSSVSASQASTDVGNALCTTINSCSAYFIDVTWSDAATCGTSTAASLMNVLAASGTGWTPSSVEACAHALAGEACNDALGNNPPAACHAPAGQVATGMPCGDSSQCQSAYCNIGTSTCGACAAARGAAGSPCYRDDDCVYGIVCTGAATTTSPATEGTCTQLVAAGGDCDTQHPCERSLACKSAMCAQPDEAGQPCSTGTCDVLAGLYCKGATGNSTGTCTKVTLAAAGAPCGLINDQVTECSAGGNCALATGATGTCQAPIADNMSCDATKGPGCTSPAVCTGGLCTVPDPANCH